MKIAIIDDDPMFSKILKNKLYMRLNHTKESTIDIYDSIVPKLYDLDYDIIFLDIMLGDKNSLDDGNQLIKAKPNKALVYISNHDNLIYDSQRYDGLFFIRKECLDKELEYFFKIYERKYKKYLQTLTITVFQKELIIPMYQIIYLSSQKYRNKINIILKQEKYETYKSLCRISLELDPKRFHRLNAHLIINLDHVKTIKSESIIMSNNDELFFTRKSKSAFLDAFSEYKRYCYEVDNY